MGTQVEQPPVERRTGQRRRGPRAYVGRRLQDIDPTSTVPLRLRDLCLLTGFSKPTLLADIDAGLLAVDRRSPRSKLILIQPREALRYLMSIGIER